MEYNNIIVQKTKSITYITFYILDYNYSSDEYANSKRTKTTPINKDGEKTITALSKEMNLSIYRTSTLTGKLAKNGLITITKNGKYKIISLSSTKPTILLKKVKNKYNHSHCKIS